MNEEILRAHLPDAPLFLDRVKTHDGFVRPVWVSREKVRFNIDSQLIGFNGMSEEEWENGFALVAEEYIASRTNNFVVGMELGTKTRIIRPNTYEEEVITIPTLNISVKRNAYFINSPNGIDVSMLPLASHLSYEVTALGSKNVYPSDVNHPKITLHRRKISSSGEIVGNNSAINLGYVKTNGYREGIAILINEEGNGGDRYVTLDSSGDIVEDETRNVSNDAPFAKNDPSENIVNS